MGQEIWKSLKGVVENGDNYSVSNLGNVKVNSTGLVRKPTTEKDGYFTVGLSYKGKRRIYKIHRLVALAFIDNPSNKEQVNHINGDKQDNKVHNLEWATSSENVVHSIKSGLKKHYKGEKHNRAILDDTKVLEIKLLLKEGHTHLDISKKYNVSRQTIGAIKTEKVWSHIKV